MCAVAKPKSYKPNQIYWACGKLSQLIEKFRTDFSKLFALFANKFRSCDLS